MGNGVATVAPPVLYTNDAASTSTCSWEFQLGQYGGRVACRWQPHGRLSVLPGPIESASRGACSLPAMFYDVPEWVRLSTMWLSSGAIDPTYSLISQLLQV